MAEFFKEIAPKLGPYKGRILGSVTGVTVGLLWAFKGFKAALVFILSTLIGYYLGKRADWNKDSLRDILNRVLPPKG